MAGGIHASSPGSATVTQQMGHSILPPDYSLHSQTIIENGVPINETSNSVDLNTVEGSTSRKRKLSADASNHHQLESKRSCIYNQLLSDMIIEKEKYLYLWLLKEYSSSDEYDFFRFVDKIKFSNPFLPFPDPLLPKLNYFISEPENFQKLFPSDVSSCLKTVTVIKEESIETIKSPKADPSSKPPPPVTPARPLSRQGTSTPAENTQHIAEKAKQEAQVLQRVAELQKLGLWTEKRLPKLQEPARSKAHWDYVLEELEWLSADFAQERKWKKAAARKRSRMIQKHFQEREQMVQKSARAAEFAKRKIASHLAKMVKTFWSSVEKLVDYKQQTKLKEKRQKALDQHLSFIVDKTEKYSSLVAESMNKSTAVTQGNSRSHSPLSDVEFEPNQSETDDEETIEAEEKNSAENIEKEIDLLRQESELPLEDLLNQLPAEYLSNISTSNDKVSRNMDDDDEYEMEEDETDDDETTLLEEEKIQGTVDYKMEIAELEADNDLSIEELMKKYNSTGADIENESTPSPDSASLASSEQDDSDDSSNEEFDDDDDDVPDLNESENENGDEKMVEDEEGDGLRSLLRDSSLENGDVNDENAINNVAAIAESIQPKGNTLSSTSVVTKVPFLLKHSLREYQHIGLDWLVTMYERKLNGILADEMGLGKTIQTIALLAHLASDLENWGPHLIIVPTSVMLNWEMEFKKWCPAFKILTYYGSPKERKLKRSGWTKPNTFHICITSYKLVLQDHHCFRRKKWQYLILDEAQNIKNFKSQRWQKLLNFDSNRRLLLTGTPLQNNLMELWSLMHFLMPNLFSSHREFKEWFSNPVTGMIEGNAEYNENIIKRLHKVLRPFLLRRLKIEVEKQLPSKYEHVIMCRLSNRQRFLYDDFMSRAKTKETLSSGNLLSVINVLMQLRKVCNHPNLFEARPIISPFQMEGVHYHTASLVSSALDYDPFRHVSLDSLNLRLADLEDEVTAWSVYRLKKLQIPRTLIEEISDTPCESPPIPKGKLSIHLKTPGDLNSIKVDENVKNNQKINSFLKTSSPWTTSSATSNTVRTLQPNASSIKPGPIFRTILAQGEIHNMAVKRTKLVENTQSNRGSYSLQLKSNKSMTPQKFCIQTGSTNKPLTVLRTVAIKNTVSCTETSHAQSSTATTPINTSTTAALSSIGVSSSSVITVSSGSTNPKLTNSIPQFVQTSSGKQLILASSLTSTSGLKTSPTVVKSGQRLILTKSVSGNVSSNSILTSLAPLIRLPNQSAQQSSTSTTTVSGTSSMPSTIILNNSVKTNISIPKPLPPTTASSSAIVSSNTLSAANSTRSKVEKGAKCEQLVPEAVEIAQRRQQRRKEKLRILADVNDRKSSPYVMFGCDVRDTLRILDSNSDCPPLENSHYWQCAGHVNCVNAQYAKHIHNMCTTLTNALANSVKSIEERIQELSETFSRYVVYVSAVNARRPTMHVSHPNPSRAWSLSYMECMLEKELAPRAKNLHQIVSRMSTAFPDGRLIQYDCGKLQALDSLLRRLKVEQHRVLIFTQMARMLDVLEAFLTFHGHIYLRLDGSTRVDQRQVLMERFNADKRYFCFILSTRSGGIGVNLIGADTVIFYDSDWNPTMDAQAQDRCHRIGQTRDVHIYRLISERTIEENILRKANQKKLLGDLAIEGGNFTSAYFKSSTIHDLFDVDLNEADPAKRITDVPVNETPAVEKTTLTAYENALAAAEDENDAAAARTAKEEAVAELAEFDETIPLENDGNEASVSQNEELSKAEQELNALIEQLTPIERWALQFMETVDTEWADEQMAAAEAEIEQQKKEWELERLAIDQADARSKRFDEETEEDDAMLTYSSEDAHNQNWVSLDSADDFMPLWLPLPVLTAEETEVYVDRSLKYLYETVPIPEHLLPPIYYRKEKKKLRLDQAVSDLVSKNSTNVRIRSRYRESLTQGTLSVAALEPPKSLFDRPSPVVAKLRQDMRLQKYRGLSRSTVANMPGMKPYFPSKGNVDPEFVPDWLIHEDYALLQAIQQVQELPLNLTVMYPGHVPNWDLVSELVNQVSRIHRSPAQCKNRFEAAILPREEGKLTSDTLSKKQKKLKGMNQLMSHSKYTRNYKTAQLYLQDSNNTFSQMMNSRFDAVRCVSNRRAPTIKRLPLTTSTKNPKHAQLLIECEIDYDNPLTPVQIATRRAQRLAKEKQTQLATHDQLLIRNVHQQQVNKQQQQQQQQQTSQQQVTVTTATTAQVAQPIIVQQLQSQQIQTQQLVSPKTIPISGANIVQQGQTAVVVSISQNSAITTASPVQIRNYVHRPVEMIVTSGNQQQTQPTSIVISQTKPVTTNATTNLISPTTIQRIIPITQISTSGTVSTTPRIVTASGKPASQVQLYKQQQTLQHQVKILHPRTKTPVLPASVVVGSSQQQRHQVSPQQPQQQQQRQLQLKPVTGTLTPATGRISEADLAAYLKKQKIQQQQKMSAATVIATSNANTVQAQFVPTTQAVIAQASKTTVGVTIPTVIPTIKTSAIGASNLKSASIATPQIRQFTIQQQIQQRKLQRVTPIGQVMVNVTQSGQGISQVLTKGAQGNVTTTQQLVNARVIPVVVSASALRAATNVPNVTIDASGVRHTQQTLPSNTIKISGSPVSVTTLSQQQHLLSQFVQNQSLVRQGNLKLSNAGLVATAISTTTGGAAASPSSAQIVSIPNIQSQITPSEKKPL